MRILHVITRLLRGGAEEKTLLEIERLGGDHAYALASGPGADPRSLERLGAAGVPYVEIPALRHYAPWAAPRAIHELRQAMRKGRYDVVHTHSTEAGLLGREAARRERIPRIVHTLHGMEFSDAHPWAIRRAVVAFHRRLAPATTRYFSNADFLTQRFLQAGIGRPDQYVLVRSGVDLAARHDAAPAAVPGAPAVLTACRLERGKGLEELVDAVAALRPRWPGMVLSVAGEGPRRDALRHLAQRRGLGEAVRFLGHRDDLPNLLRSAHVFVLASHREGTPRVVTEAMAAGCPVVATGVDGVPEQVENGSTGWLVPPGDVPALARALGDALERPAEAQARAERGRRRAEEFGLARMTASLRRAYADLEVGA